MSITVVASRRTSGQSRRRWRQERRPKRKRARAEDVQPQDAPERDREDHNLTHMPNISWCDICIAARGTANPHPAGAGAEITDADMPKLGVDYWFVGSQKGDAREEPAEADQAHQWERNPMLAMYEKLRKVMFGHRVRAKGPDPQVVRQVVNDLDGMGICRATHRTDQEFAVASLFDVVRLAWTG